MTTIDVNSQIIPGAKIRRRKKRPRKPTTPPAQVNPTNGKQPQTSIIPAIIPDTQKQMALVPTSALYSPEGLAQRLAVYSSVREQFINWIRKEMTPGVDFQLIHRKIGQKNDKKYCPNDRDHKSHGCEKCGGKATLCKPGSEKITALLQLQPRFKKDTDTLEMIGGGAGTIALICELVNVSTGEVVAEGRGARRIEQDFADINKSIKMTQKSAQTDAVLRCAGISEIFTQDLEDMPQEVVVDGDRVDTQTGEIKPDPTASKTTASGHTTFNPETEKVTFGKYGPNKEKKTEGMLWIEVPWEYLEWLKTNASRADVKARVAATMAHKQKLQQMANVTEANVVDEIFPDTPVAGKPDDIDLAYEGLTSSLDTIALTRESEKITAWGISNAATIHLQTKKRQEFLKKVWQQAMIEARKVETAGKDKVAS